MYFWPLPGTSTNITTFNPSTGTFSTLPIDPAALSMTKGVAMAAVEAEGGDDFLGVSGGGTKNVLAYNLRTGQYRSTIVMMVL